MRREKSLRIGVRLANGVVWGLVYRTHLGAGVAAVVVGDVELVGDGVEAVRDGDEAFGAERIALEVERADDRAARRAAYRPACAGKMRRRRRRRADGRSIQANVGVELKGVSWS